MGFLDYAWIVSFQKDNKKVKILQDSTLDQPTIEPDNYGFTLKLPTVQFLEKGQISYLGAKVPLRHRGQIQGWATVQSGSAAFNHTYACSFP